MNHAPHYHRHSILCRICNARRYTELARGVATLASVFPPKQPHKTSPKIVILAVPVDEFTITSKLPIAAKLHVIKDHSQ